MINIPLQAIPNQALTIQLDESLYNIILKVTNGVMVATIIRDNIIIISGARIVAGYPIIPYLYKEDGNFILLTANGDYPHYTQFGLTQNLIFASEAELEIIRAT